jgi:hypothetical protein
MGELNTFVHTKIIGVINTFVPYSDSCTKSSDLFDVIGG